MVGSPAEMALLLALAAIGAGAVLAVLLGYLFVVEPTREHEYKMKLLRDAAVLPGRPESSAVDSDPRRVMRDACRPLTSEDEREC